MKIQHIFKYSANILLLKQKWSFGVACIALNPVFHSECEELLFLSVQSPSRLV